MKYEIWEALEVLAEENSGRVLLNKGEKRASQSLVQLINSSNKIVRIWEKSFDRAFFNGNSYLKSVRNFLDRGGDLRIMIKSEENASLFYDFLLEKKKLLPDQINILSGVKPWIKYPRWTINSREEAPLEYIYFATGDSKIYRICYDSGELFTQFSFNDSKMAEAFDSHFDKKYAELS